MLGLFPYENYREDITVVLKNRSPRFKRYGLISLVLIIALCGGLVIRFALTDKCQTIALVQRPQAREFVQARSIIESSAEASNLWSMKADIHFQQDIISANDLIILSDALANDVVALQFRSGEEVWVSSVCTPSDLAFDSSRNQIYVFGESPLSVRAILALDVSNGQQQWVNDSQGKNRVGLTPMISRDDELFVYRFPDPAIFRVDPDSGAFSEPIAYDPRSPNEYLAVEADLNDIGNDFYWDTGAAPITFEVRSAENHEVVWTVPLARGLDQVEVLDNMFILASSPRITALEKDTGAELWSFDGNFASNIAIDDGIVYVLDTSANLLMLDIESGETINHIQFEPPTPQTNRDINESWVGVYENQIAIYFRDMQTLQVVQIEKG